MWQRFQPLLRESGSCSYKCLSPEPLGGGLGVSPTRKFCKFNFFKVAFHVFWHRGGVQWRDWVRQHRIGKGNTERFTLSSGNFVPSFQNFMINWENVIKIRRTGGNLGDSWTNYWEGWNLWMWIKISYTSTAINWLVAGEPGNHLSVYFYGGESKLI